MLGVTNVCFHESQPWTCRACGCWLTQALPASGLLHTFQTNALGPSVSLRHFSVSTPSPVQAVKELYTCEKEYGIGHTFAYSMYTDIVHLLQKGESLKQFVEAIWLSENFYPPEWIGNTHKFGNYLRVSVCPWKLCLKLSQVSLVTGTIFSWLSCRK